MKIIFLCILHLKKYKILSRLDIINEGVLYEGDARKYFNCNVGDLYLLCFQMGVALFIKLN